MKPEVSPCLFFSSHRVTTVVTVVAEMTTNRFVANVTYLLKPHVASMLHLHLVFLTQALCYYSWISDDRRETWGKSEKWGSLPPLAGGWRGQAFRR